MNGLENKLKMEKHSTSAASGYVYIYICVCVHLRWFWSKEFIDLLFWELAELHIASALLGAVTNLRPKRAPQPRAPLSCAAPKRSSQGQRTPEARS